MQVVNLDGSSDDRIFALVYGGSGTGKTHLMGTVGALGRTLICDIDQGYKTIKYAPDITKAMKDNITIASFDVFKDLDGLYKAVAKNNPAHWSNILSPKVGPRVEISAPFDWIILDTWSELQWFMLQELRSKDSEMAGSGGLDFRKNIQIQHWGMMTDLNKLAVERFRDLPVNMILTMQEKMEKDEVTGGIIGGPAIHGKMVQEMPTFFDIVVRTETDIAGGYVATTKCKGKWPAKTRIGVGATYKNPTAAQLFTPSK